MKCASASLPVDVLARELPDRVAIYAGGLGCHDEADRLAREVAQVLEAYELRLRVNVDAPASSSASRPGAPAFRGRTITAQFPGRCAVCSGGVAAGDVVLYDRDSKRVAHPGCGGVSP